MSQLFALSNQYETIYNRFDLTTILILLSAILLIILLFLLIKNIRKKKIIEAYNRKLLDNNYYILNKVTKSLENLNNKNFKSVYYNLKEINIYLDSLVNKTTLQNEKFNLIDFFNQFKKDINEISCDVEFLYNSSLSYNILFSKDILYNILFILVQHQIHEHKLNKCVITVSLSRKDKKLLIEILGLPYDDDIKKILTNKEEPIYDFKNNHFHGIYLYIINKLLQKIKGIMQIDISSNIYSLTIQIPVKTEIVENRVKLLLPIDKLEDIKVLMVTSNEKYANLVGEYLSAYNIVSDYINPDKTVDLPDFLSYNILIADSAYLNSIVSDYILSIKGSTLKVVAIEEHSHKYQDNLVDYVIKTPILQSKIYKMILELYSKACFDLDEFNKKTEATKEFKQNRVLIADDNSLNLKLLTKILELHNINVVGVKDGQEVLNILNKDDNFDLIILDSIMPKMDAYATIKEIRKREKLNSIPVVIHTSFSYDHSIDEIFELGFDSYLPKPFTDEQLITLLHRYLKIPPKKDYNKKINKESLEEFLAIYANSGKILEKYIKQNQFDRAKSLLNDLKTITMKIDKRSLLKSIKEIEKEIDSNNINMDMVNDLQKELENSVIEVQEDLEKFN